MLNLSDNRQEERTFKNFTVLYAVALTIIALVTIVSQFLIQRYLSNQMNDAHVVNFTARLRTYSQSLSKTALLLESGRDIETNRKEFVNTLKQWQKSHEGLLAGSDFLNLPDDDQYEIKMMYEIIKMPYEEIVDASNSMIEELYSTKPLDSLNIRPFIQRILANEKAYLIGMELIVFDYDRFSRNAIIHLKKIEYLLLIFVLGTLLLEALLIFAPLATRIKKVIKGLVDSEDNAQLLANELQNANKTLELSHKKLRETNYALEKAAYVVKIDASGNIIYANDKYCNVTKYAMAELRGKPLFYNNMGGNESIIYQHIRNEELKTEVWQGEIFDHASDGTGFWLDVTLMPVIDNQKVLQYLVIANDITKRKKTEQELQHLMEDRLHQQQMEQTAISYSFINGQEKERKRVAAEIHDGIGQMMTSMRMKLEMIEAPDLHDKEQLDQVHDLLISIIGETKKICADLSPSVLNDFGLNAAIKELIRGLHDSFQIEFNVENNLKIEVIDREIEIGVYRIIQESINNILKHANANQVFLHISNDKEYISVKINDNGKGFTLDEDKIFGCSISYKANGLRNMKERAELLGGMFSISSKQGVGTEVKFEIPI